MKTTLKNTSANLAGPLPALVMALILFCLAGVPRLSGQTLKTRFAFNDSGTTTTDSVAHVVLNLVNTAGTATDLHSGAGTGPGAQGNSLLFSPTTSGHGGAGPLAYTTGNSTINFGVVTNFTCTVWIKPVGTLLTNVSGGAAPRFFVIGANGTTDKGAANSMGLTGNNTSYTGPGSPMTSANAYANLGQASTTAWGAYAMPTNQWTFLALVYDGATIKLYGGTETNAATLASSQSLVSGTINLGSSFSLFLGNRSTRDRVFWGAMADARFYTGAGNSNFVELARESAFAPTTPTNLTVTTCFPPRLAWSPASGATGYIVKRSTIMGTETNYDTTGTAGYTDFNVTNGTTYYYTVVATNQVGTTGASSSEVSVTVAGSGFSFTTQPLSQTECEGSTATFSTSISGGSGLTYQWQSSTNGGVTWNDLAGATTTNYTTAALPASANGTEYQMAVSNACGLAGSTTAATLTVNPLPTVTLQPSSQTIVSNWGAVFTVKAPAALTYQWQQNGTNLVDGVNVSGSTNPVLTLANVPLTLSGSTYACVVANGCGVSTSGPPAVLTVNTSISNNLMMQFGFEDAGTTTTDSVSGVSLNMVDSFGSPQDDHGAPGSGVLGQGQALSLLGGAQGGTGPMAFTTGNSQTNFGTISSFTATLWINPNTTNLNGANVFPRYLILGTNGIADASYSVVNSMGLVNNANGYPGALTSLSTIINASQPPATNWGAYPMPASKWTFLAVTYDGSNLKLYGGSESSSVTLASIATNFLVAPVNGVGPFSLFLGNRLAQDRGFSGLMDDVRIYRGAAPASDVEKIRQASVNTPFSIVTNPANQGTCEGSTATFAVVTSGSGLTYQWQNSTDGGLTWNPISGATGTTYTTGPVYASDSGTLFDVLVNNGVVSLPSSSATLTVSVAPTVTLLSASQTIASNWTAVFQAQVTPSGQPCQWLQNGTNLVDGPNVSGSTNLVLKLSNVPLAFSGYTYRCAVSNTCGQILSAPATLTVTALPTNMLVQFQFKDSGTTTTDSVAGVTLNLVDSNGVATDLHSAPGTGVAGQGQALNLHQPGSVQQGAAGPLAFTTNNSSVNFGSLNAFTVTLWLKPVSPLYLGGFPRFLILGTNGISDGSVPNSLQLIGNSSRVAAGTSMEQVVNTHEDDVFNFGAFNMPTNEWAFFAASYDGQTLRFYGGYEQTNVSLQCTQSNFLAGSVNIGSAFSLFIGNRLTSDRCFDGLLDDVRIYPGAVTSAGDLESIRQAASPTVPAVASFTVLPASGVRPLQVTFTDHSSGSINNDLWSFGDGATTNTAPGSVLTHVYLVASNSYQAILTASGPGGSSTATNSIDVVDPNPPHISQIGAGVGSVTIQGTNGPASAIQTYYYELLTSTNLALARSSWMVVATNAFNSNGSFSNNIPVTPGDQQRFYLLQMP